MTDRSLSHVLVTGGCGFIGSHLVRHLLGRGYVVTNLDALTYAGRPENLSDVDGHEGYHFVHGDIRDLDSVRTAAAHADAIVNVAAETHVDRSIEGGDEFVTTNVLGTKRLLDVARERGLRFLQVSTDEVYGDVEAPRRSLEGDPLHGSSPYSASKAAADLLVLSYVRTYGLDASITRGSNTYGPNQFPEKLIPLFITNLLEDKKVPVYGDGLQSREMLWVGDHAQGIRVALERGAAGEAYNVGAEHEVANIETTRSILAALGKDESSIEYVADRPGHDRRYAIDCTRLRELGWEREVGFDEGLARTIDWFRSNRTWWEAIRAGSDYQSYHDRTYAGR
jgi:dTDP-glucose 4,6-dehydratase